MDPASGQPPLILHVLYRFDTGGLENGVVNLINHMAPDRFRHAILAIDEINASFASRLRRTDVSLHALHKAPGHAYKLYPRINQLLRQLKPAIVHSRNLAALEAQVPAAWARVPVRIHGEHGWDASDPDGRNPRQRLIRRLYAPFVHRYITVSRDLQRYLVDRVGIAAGRVQHLCNGVDTVKFQPPAGGPLPLAGCPFDPARHWIVGTVGRLQAVKNQTLLAQAFVMALERHPAMRERARLVIVGDGALRPDIESLLAGAGHGDRAWLAGERRDVAAVMQGLHLFVLPSLAEGISNTILEAMASGLPVVATAVGGNPELVTSGQTGLTVPSADAAALADVLVRLYQEPETVAAWGRRARSVAESRFSLQGMVDNYAAVYDNSLQRRAGAPSAASVAD